MIERERFNGQVEALESLLQSKLGVRGRTLSKRFARAGRRLPGRIQKAGRVITDFQSALDHPKLARLHDPGTVNAAFTEVRAHLNTIDPSERRKVMVLRVLGSAVFNLIVLVVAVIVFLRWQGLI